MSSVREPSLGPIVGATTDHSCRLWIRGADAGSRSSPLDEDRRTIGVLSMTHRGGQRQAFYFRLRREYDRTGTFNLGEDHNFKMSRAPSEKSQQSVPLAPATPYEVRLGSLTLDDPFASDAEVPTSGLLERLPPLGSGPMSSISWTRKSAWRRSRRSRLASGRRTS